LLEEARPLGEDRGRALFAVNGDEPDALLGLGAKREEGERSRSRSNEDGASQRNAPPGLLAGTNATFPGS
jgi:hypothetical protein